MKFFGNVSRVYSLPHYWQRRVLCAVLAALTGLIVAGCTGETDPTSPSPSPGAATVDTGKADSLADAAFPAARDLALLVPMDEATIGALDLLPASWLTAVVDGLAASELDEAIDEESWPEDWKLVSGRFTVCSPLGKRAIAEEIDRLCWPEIRLVWQPIVKDANVFGRVRPYYAEDRAIHTLYHVAHQDTALRAMGVHLGAGGGLDDIDATTLADFEAARDRAGLLLLDALFALRGASGPFEGIAERPEYYDAQSASPFSTKLLQTLKAFCVPEALHELTAFSLPMGRNPAGADLWSFIGFAGRNGRLTPATLAVHDAETGEELFAFPFSENVTTGGADPALLDALETMPDDQRMSLEAQVIIDTAERSAKEPRINDPYQTLVPNTTCTSCHRSNNINFNFHNLSYLEDQEISIAPRVTNDVLRDLALARILWNQ